jgi:hypothetical protein
LLPAPAAKFTLFVIAAVGNDTAASFVVLHESVVHALASLHAASDWQQFGSAVPGWQEPPLQVSPVVQIFPSLHGAALLACWHVLDPTLQLSSVQMLASLQSAFVKQQPAIAACWQALPLQESAVHGLPSSHCAAVLQHPGTAVWAHRPLPMAGLMLVLQTGPLVSVPFSAGVVESAALVPAASFKPQRPMRPVPAVSC